LTRDYVADAERRLLRNDEAGNARPRLAGEQAMPRQSGSSIA